MEAIQDIVKNVMHVWGAKKHPGVLRDFELSLEKLLTKKESGHIKFNYFRRGILNITVDSSVWLYHLSLKKDDLLAGLHKGFAGIKDIRFRLGRVK